VRRGIIENTGLSGTASMFDLIWGIEVTGPNALLPAENDHKRRRHWLTARFGILHDHPMAALSMTCLSSGRELCWLTRPISTRVSPVEHHLVSGVHLVARARSFAFGDSPHRTKTDVAADRV
jgi:hypothetical protein